MRQRNLCLPASILLLYWHCILDHAVNVKANSSSSPSSSSSSSPLNSIPRSINARSIYSESSSDDEQEPRRVLPPWNPSPNIDQNGFLTLKYKRIHGDWEFESPPDARTISARTTSSTAARISRKAFHERKQPKAQSFVSTDQIDCNPNPLDDENDDDDIGHAPKHVIGGRFQNLHEPVYIRQVPGDGNCLFHSLSIGLALLTNHTHVDMTPSSGLRRRKHTRNDIRNNVSSYRHDLKHLHHHSRYLRHCAVQMLSRRPKRLLFLQGNEYLRARDLVSAAAAQYGMTAEEYCDQMRKDSYWGGGPEIVALCNYLKRPIHVYELSHDYDWKKDVDGGNSINVENDDIHENDDENDRLVQTGENHPDNRQPPHDEDQENQENHGNKVHASMGCDCDSAFRLRRMACFGSPKFDHREALHILSADSRFPDVEPGKQLSSGNHFLTMFPESVMHTYGHGQMGRSVKDAPMRGGDSGDYGHDVVRRPRWGEGGRCGGGYIGSWIYIWEALQRKIKAICWSMMCLF